MLSNVLRPVREIRGANHLAKDGRLVIHHSRMASGSVNRRIAESAGIVMVTILASRFLGFAREWTVAHQIGSNASTDAYYAAFTLPDFLNYLVAGGALTVTFIPLFARYAAEGNEDEAWGVFSTVITTMGVLLLALVALGEVFAPALARIIAPGFNPAERSHVIFLTRVMMPAQCFFYLGGILSAVQYAKARFLIPSLAPVIYNLGVIAGGFFLSARIGVAGFAVGVLGGAFVGNFLLQIYGARRLGARFRPRLDWRHPGFRHFVKLTLPIMLALSIVYTDDWILRWFASYLPAASITWLSYAKTLMRVPQGVVGQAVGVASFPFLAQLFAEKKFDALNQTINSTVKALLFMLLPISALSIVESRPVVYLVFSHTRLRGADFGSTAAALGLFSAAMFAWGVQGILARSFYASHDTLTPAIAGTSLTFLALPVYWLLARHWQFRGLAAASSIAVIAYAATLFFLLNRRTHNREAGRLLVFFLKVLIASGAAAGAALAALRPLESHIAWTTTGGAFIVLVPATLAGLLAFVAAAKLLRVRELGGYVRSLGSVLRRAG